jgi:membrane protein implicated in regulation of membrane protease activity
LARLDLGLGLVAALVLLLATPGLAMTALIALAVLALCLLSAALERRARRRGPRARDDARTPARPRRRAR